MSTTILLVRHGETDWNREKIFRGVYDVPLNDNGRHQAQLAAKALSSYKIDAGYTSPLSRAAETLTTVIGQGNPIPRSPSVGRWNMLHGTRIHTRHKFPRGIHSRKSSFDLSRPWRRSLNDMMAKRWRSLLTGWSTSS